MMLNEQIDDLIERMKKLSAELSTINDPTDPRLAEIEAKRDVIAYEVNKFNAIFQQNWPRN